MKSPFSSYFGQVSFVKNPIQNVCSLFFLFDWKFVIKAPKYIENDLCLQLLFYLSKNLIIKKKRYLFLLLPLSKDIYLLNLLLSIYQEIQG